MNTRAKALIVDDEPDIRELIAVALERIGLDTHTAGNLGEAYHLLDAYSFDVCLTDMRLPDGNGIELVRHVQAIRSELPIAVITAHGNMDAAVEAMKCGAFDFVSKPVDIGRLRGIVSQAIGAFGVSAIERRRGGESSSAASSGLPTAPIVWSDFIGEDRLVGTSPPMRDLRQLIAKVARTNAPVWITGESGTGKELIARLIHENGSRSGAPFVAINCGAIPSELMESELFGHRKGSFTGAISDNEGLFRQAEGGTLLLDEVAELPLHMQVKLLRAIQERSIRPVGGREEIPVDVRILSASHADLGVEVEAGRFRHDLYYRLNVISIRSPSLRERPDDIEALIQAILDRQWQDDRESPASARPALSSAALAALIGHDFPGNVRELENILERATALCNGAEVEVKDLALRQRRSSPPDGEGEGTVEGSKLRVKVAESDLSENADDAERQRIVAALEAARWNRRKAAATLGMTYRQLRYRIARMGLDDDASPEG